MKGDIESGVGGSVAETLAQSRRAALRLGQSERWLIAGATALLATAGAIGVALAAGVEAQSTLLAGVIAGAVLLGLVLVGMSRRALALLAVRRREVDTLEIARAAQADVDVDVDAAAILAFHPYRADGGRPAVAKLTPEVSVATPESAGSNLFARTAAVVALASLLGVAADACTHKSALSQVGKIAERWTFLEGATPSEVGLDANVARASAWTLEGHSSATGGRALVSHRGDPNASADIVIAKGNVTRDARATTRCMVASAEPGNAATACGVVYRFVDAKNYAVARIEPTAKRIEVVHVEDGSEMVLGGANVAAASADVWQEIAVEARARAIRVSWNGRVVLDVVEPASSRATEHGGRIGLWASPAAKAWFDELAIEPLIPDTRTSEGWSLLGGRRPG